MESKNKNGREKMERKRRKDEWQKELDCVEDRGSNFMKEMMVG